MKTTPICSSCRKRPAEAPAYSTCRECRDDYARQIRQRRDAQRRLPPLTGSEPVDDLEEVHA